MRADEGIDRGADRRAERGVGISADGVVPIELVDRVRARLAGLGVEPEPDEVVRAVRAESGMLHGHLDLLREMADGSRGV